MKLGDLRWPVSIIAIFLEYNWFKKNTYEIFFCTLNRGGSSLNRGGSSLSRGGSSLNWGGNSLNRGGNSLNRGGNSLNRGGTGSVISEYR
jgi:hypothetical protein